MNLRASANKLSFLILCLLAFCNFSKAQSHIKIEKNGRSFLLYKGQRFNYIDLNDQNQQIKRGRLIDLTSDSSLIFNKDTVAFDDFVFANRSKIFSAEIYKKPIALGLIGAGLISTSFAYGIESLNFGDKPAHYKENINELFSDYNHTIIYAASTGAFWTYIYMRNRYSDIKLREEWKYELILE